MSTQKPIKPNIYPIIGGIVFAIILVVVGIILVLWAGRTRREPALSPEVMISQIPAPTPTTEILLPTQSMIEATAQAVVIPPGMIGIGIYVQVTGTDGSGLRMRAEPGTSGEVRFVAMDAEAFLVIGGPVEQDEYTWWQLEAPYDKNRTGWSVDAFLSPLEDVSPTP
jgi:hypothetical protein